MNKGIAAAVVAALALAAAPFLAARSLPLPGLEAAIPGVGAGGIYILETISLVEADIPTQAGQEQGPPHLREEERRSEAG